ncbi:hypothetical protein, partial [Klebsiella pneumoniae]|uniref:hypothetical protein n=1 Tax=Klebsiella pneumoniae TaxID=573 RepID=UPI001D0DA5D7
TDNIAPSALMLKKQIYLVFISNYALNLSRARDILKTQKSEPPKLTQGIDSVPPELTSRYTL